MTRTDDQVPGDPATAAGGGRSRVLLGTLGHHSDWRYADQEIETASGNGNDNSDDSNDSDTGDGSNGADSAGNDTGSGEGSDTGDGSNGTDDAGGDGFGPGMGAGATLAGLGGVTALLWRRLRRADTAGEP